MPPYEFQCVDCGNRDERLAGAEDHMVICAECGGLMLRLEDNVSPPILQSPFYPRRVPMIRNNLIFEVRWLLQELVRKHGVVAVMNSDRGKRLYANLEALESPPQRKAA
jgi:hypothetical protein